MIVVGEEEEGRGGGEESRGGRRGGKETMTGGTGRLCPHMLVVLPLDEEIVMRGVCTIVMRGGGGKGRRGGKGTMTGGTGRPHPPMLIVLPLDKEMMTQSMYDCNVFRRRREGKEGGGEEGGGEEGGGEGRQRRRRGEVVKRQEDIQLTMF
jgi:hypothetical protein